MILWILLACLDVGLLHSDGVNQVVGRGTTAGQLGLRKVQRGYGTRGHLGVFGGFLVVGLGAWLLELGGCLAADWLQDLETLVFEQQIGWVLHILGLVVLSLCAID